MVDLISTKTLLEVHPIVRDRGTHLVNDCAAVGIYLRIIMGLRSQNLQHTLYIQGRQPLDVVNEARAAVNLARLTDEENIEVTHADYLESMHCFGLAFDAAPSQGSIAEPFNPDWKVTENGVLAPKWATVLAIAAEHKLAEGASWTMKKRDYPHFYPIELDPTPTPEMQQALKDAGITGVWHSLERTLLPF